MASNDINQQLDRGIAAARRGEKAVARQMLEDVLRQDGNNELAWIWLASVVPTKRERRICLERVLQINPNNERAREALIKLVGIGGSDTVDSRDLQRGAAFQRPTPALGGTEEDVEAGATSNRNTYISVLTVLVVFVGLTLLATLATPSEQVITPPPTATFDSALFDVTRTAIAAASITPSVTLTPTFPGVVVTRMQPSLPPTFTPTPSATPSNTPTPSATPFPLGDFTLLYTARGNEDINPALYRASGDGSQAVAVLQNVRDVTYDLRREQVAFVRDVEREDGPTSAEIFIAPVGDITSVQQVTNFGSGAAASPTFSLDGRYLVFSSDVDGDDEIYAYDLQTQQQSQLTSNGDIDRDPHFSFDGRSIVFASNRGESSALDLYLIRLSGVENPFQDRVVERLTETRSNSYAPQWSPDNRQIAYADDQNGAGDIFVYDVERRVSRQLTRDAGDEDRAPTWTPDGRAVAFISNRESGRFQIYTYTLDQRQLQRVTQTINDVQSLDYRPDLRFRVNLLD